MHARTLTIALIRWSDPGTWPWEMWGFAATILFGWVKLLLNWIKSQMAMDWPAATGRIESAQVSPKRHILPSSLSHKKAEVFTAELVYTYTVEGRTYTGFYKKDFDTKEQGLEFVWELQGRTVEVSYKPGNAAKSLLTAESVAALLRSRPPIPEGKFRVPVKDIPKWVKPFIWPLAGLSAIGLGVSVWIHLGTFAGRKMLPEWFLWVMFAGMFAVWFPALFVAKARIGPTGGIAYWKRALKGSPEWLRYLVYGLYAYMLLSINYYYFRMPHGGSGGVLGESGWRGFSAICMAIYATALAILYAAAEDQARYDF